MKFHLVFPLVLFVHSIAFSQLVEICNNGIDDDHDGFIDCYDGSCANSSSCAGIFLGNDANCQAIPPQFPKFTMSLDFSSPNETTNHLSRMVIGDYDRDGMPEIATMNRYTNKIYILNGNNGGIKYQATVGFEPYWEIATANIDNDNCAELFYIGYLPELSHTEKINGKKVKVIDQEEGIYMFAYDCQLNFLWRTVHPFPQLEDPINYGVADFDGDGQIEIYAKDEIYDAKTGTRLIASTAADYTQINGGPVAVNMMGDNNLELVLGLNIYQVNLNTRTLDGGSLTLLQGRNDYFIRNVYNATSVADYNLDGSLDVLASGSTGKHGKNTTVFYWDVKNNVVKTYSDPQPSLGSDYVNGWINGTGRLNVADLDGDGKMNVSYVSGRFLYALNENFGLLWRANINEETSGYTGCTLFDFNGDGKAEIVYRDERYLYIINGTDGSNYQNPQPCISRTNREYPIVADVDADGSTEICVTCGFNDAQAAANFNTISYSRYSHVRVFKSANEPWVPARRIWNQHGYFVVNVNDDLTIPRVMQAHQLVWSTGSCTQGPNRPLNKFLNQSPFLNSKGCPTYAAVDLSFSSIKPVIKPPQCPDVNFTVSLQITNLGDVPLTGNVPISFYNANPKKAGASKLNTINVPLNNLGPNGTYDINNMAINGTGSDSLYLVLNDAGTTVPTPISLPNGTFFECNYTDNIFGAGIHPLPVTITATEVNPNNTCSASNNGAARAFVPIPGGGENTTDYNFYWFKGTTAKAIASADFVGPVYSGLQGGTYTVFARHKTSGCGSDTTQAVVTTTGAIPQVSISLVSNQTVCNPLNGKLNATVTGGNSGFTFDWYDVSLAPLGLSGPTVGGLAAGTYVVVASKGGCTAVSSPVTVNGPLIPDAQAKVLQNITDCLNPNNGSVQADAVVGGVVQNPAGYTFEWYFYDNATSTRGSILPVANGTGNVRTGLAAGYYQAVVKETASQCAAFQTPVVQVQDLRTTPTPVISQVTAQTSCDTNNPNGSLISDVKENGVVQDPAGYTFEWFKGANTLPGNAHHNVSGVKGRQADKVPGGGIPYTVKVTNSAHCFGTAQLVIAQTLTNPVLTVAVTNNGVCDPLLASSNYTGSLQATVTFGGVPVSSFTDYTFKWHNGSLITDPLIAVANDQSPTLSQLNGGTYTVELIKNDVTCNATPVTVVVKNVTTLPTVVATPTASTNCTGGSPNGTMAAVVNPGGVTAGYSFTWHQGNSTAGAVVGNTASVSGLQGGQNFTVEVINITTGCSATKTKKLPDNSSNPVISLTATPNSICDPTLTSPAVNFNGSVSASVTDHGSAVGNFAGYTFVWHNGALATDPVNGSSSTKDLIHLNGGFYSVTVKNNALNCTSSPVSAQVINNKTVPVLTTATVPSTNCIPALKNGQASVTDVDGAGTGAPYTFKWYDGDFVVPGSEKALIPIYNSVQGGVGQDYTVLVTNQSNGCQNTKTVQVVDKKELPVITLSSTDNTICVGNNGTASLATLTYQSAPVLAPFAGYTFSWSNGATTANINSLPANDYTLTVTRTNVGCTSSAVTVTVKDKSFTPVINITPTPQTSCDPTALNGILAAVVDETSIGGGASVTAGYTFVWHSGTLVSDPVVTTTTGIPGKVNQLTGNQNYVVAVSNSATGCSNLKGIFLPETKIIPGVTFTATNPLTRCDTPNGSMTATVSQVPMQSYTYYWLKEQPSTTTTDPADVISAVNASPAFPNRRFTGGVGAATDNFSNLIPGDYTIVTVDTYTTCVSQPVTGTIIDNSLKANITITLGPGFPSSCGIADGQLSTTITGGVGPFDIFWHRTGPVNSNINFFDNPPVFTPPNNIPILTALATTSSSLNNVGSNAYTVIVTDKGNGCGNYKTDFLPFVNAHTLTPTLTPSTICPIVSGNGNIKVTVGNVAAGKTFQDYTYKLYAGENADPLKQVGPTIGPGAAVTNPQSFPTPLAAGKYVIEVRQAFLSNCPAFEVVEVLQNALPPAVALVGPIQPNTTCDPLQSDGSVALNIQKDPDDVTVGSTYTLDVSPTPLGGGPYPTGPLGVGPQVLIGLQPDAIVPQYTVTITSSNNCVTQRFIVVPDQPATAELDAANIAITPADLCTASGSVEVTAISIVGGGADNINNYKFDWFTDVALTAGIYSQQGDNTAVKGGEFLDKTTYASIGAGSYWVTATRTVPGQPGFGCTSAPFKADINDASIKPSVTLVGITNTACDVNYEGKIQVLASDSGGPGAGMLYTYAWDPGNPVAIPITANNDGDGVGATDAPADGDNPSNLKEGTYKVTVTNNATGCSTPAQVTLLKSTSPVVITSASHTDQKICNPDGSITIGPNDVTVSGIVDPVHTNFVFDWYRNAPGGPAVATGTGVDILNTGTYAAIGSGDYFVTAKRAPGVPFGSGCQSPPLKVTIKDVHVVPTVSLATIANTSCNNTFDGKITITANDASGLGSNFDFNWTSVPALSSAGNALNVPSPYSTGGTDNIGPGKYVVVVRNTATNCTTQGTADMTSVPNPVDILSITKADQLKCYPDGQISVSTLSPGVIGDYSFNWFFGDPNSAPLVDGTNVAITASSISLANYPAMGAGTFYVVATKNALLSPGAGCKTPPFRVDLLNQSVNPKVQLTFTPNTSCDLSNPNGTVLAAAAEQNGANTDNYSFTWGLNGGALPGITTQTNTNNSSTLAAAMEGNYSLVIKNVSNTGCSFTSSIKVDLNQNLSKPNIIDVSTTNPLDCKASGSAEVTSVSIGGGPPVTGAALATSFSYEWYQSDYSPANIMTSTAPLNAGILPGQYFVLVRDLSTQCKSIPKEADIANTQIVYPVAKIAQTALQISCTATTGTAALAGTGDGQNDTNPNYSFTWYNSLDLSGPVYGTTSSINNLVTGSYSVDVKNLTTGCSASAFYIVPNDVPTFMPVMSLGGQPRTLCIGVDGTVLAKVIDISPSYPFPLNYTADLYFGGSPNLSAPPDIPSMAPLAGFTATFLERNLKEGTYTVRITDNNTSCTVVDKIDVLDKREFPAPFIDLLSPTTNCDPLRANGVAKVAVNGQVGGFEFTWYEGAAVNGSPTYTGVQFSELKPMTYTVQAMDLTTGCTGIVQTTVPNGAIPIPVPNLDKLSDVTSCVTNNGSLAASVGADKNTRDYTFDWYDGTQVTPPSDFVGETYSDLGEGIYSVTATSNITGCKSPPVAKAIVKAQEYPDFDFQIRNSTCDKADGFATLTLTSNVPIADIEWQNGNGPFQLGPNLKNVTAGTYTATVTSNLGCVTTKEVEILPEIRPFNGISRNGDGQNEIFQIDCIQNFPNNIVKIYNRAGTLVYEANFYDNSNTYFDGRSNRGVSFMGTHLPDGTYFYIVDKRNGSKPVAGYLEIVE
jgi:gliding motility-associated-like protein